MTKHIISAVALTAVALSACAPGVEITSPPQAVSFTSAQAQTNIYAQAPIAIRTVTISTVDGKQQTKEIVGAACAIKGTGYTAKFQTPAKINLPTYKGRTDPVAVTCKANGKTASQTFKATNLTTSTQTTYVGGLAGALVAVAATAAIRAARNPANDVYAYQGPMRVAFEDAKTPE